MMISTSGEVIILANPGTVSPYINQSQVKTKAKITKYSAFSWYTEYSFWSKL